MNFNLSITAENFKYVANSFDNLGEHSYLSITRDGNNNITQCLPTQNRDERASLKDINEFVNICFKQYSPDEVQAFDDINSIQVDLQTIKDHVENKERGCCGHLWFLIKLGHSILAGTDEIIKKISNLAQNIIPDKKEQAKEKDKKGQNNSSTSIPEIVEIKKEDKKHKINISNSIADTIADEIKNEKNEKKDTSSKSIESTELIETHEKKELSEIDAILAKAQECTKLNNTEGTSTAYFQASQYYEKEGKVELSFEYLHKSCEMDESDLKAVIRLGKCYEHGELGQEKDLYAAERIYFSAVIICTENNVFCDELLPQCKNVLRCHASKPYQGERDCSCKTIVIMAENSFDLDLSSIIPDQFERAKLYFAAAKDIESKTYLSILTKEKFTNLANTLVLLSAKEGNPEAMSYLGSKKQPGSDDWFFEAAVKYTELGQDKYAIKQYEKSAESGNLKAINFLSNCFETGTMRQKVDRPLACKYQLDAANIYFELNNFEMLFTSCQNALRLDQSKAIAAIILNFKLLRFLPREGLDLFALLKKQEIYNPSCIHKGYIDNIKFYLSHKPHLEKALEQCKYSLQFGPLTPAIVLTLVEIYNVDLAELVPDQKNRAELYFEAAKLCYKQREFHNDSLNNIELFLKAADEGNIEAMLELASIYTEAKEDELAFSMWIKSVKLGSIVAAEKIIKKKGNLNDIIIETPEAMEKLGKAFLEKRMVFSFYISESDRIQNISDEKEGLKLLLDSAKRYEETEQKKKAFEIYQFLAGKFSKIEILERLALCFENGELEQKIDLNIAGDYYCKIAEIYNKQIELDYSDNTLLQRQASLKACLKAFMFDSDAAIEMLLVNLKDKYANLFDDDMKDMIAKKIAKFLDSYTFDPFCVDKNKRKSREIAEKFVEIEKKLGLKRDKYKF